MKFVEFLVYVLQTQGETLQRLAAFFGEEELFELLEAAGDHPDPQLSSFSLNPSWFEPSEKTSNYAALDNVVRELKLPAVLEFHLWAYPFYRILIEAPIELKAQIRHSSENVVDLMVNEALSQATTWVKKLPIRPELSAQAERIALIPWLRFRSEVLKKAGKRPIISVL